MNTSIRRSFVATVLSMATLSVPARLMAQDMWYQWKAAANGQAADHPISGVSENGDYLYVCMADLGSDRMVVGKLYPKYGRCFVGYNGTEYSYTSYMTLAAEGVYWDYAQNVPFEEWVAGGYEGSDHAYVCAVNTSVGRIPGKYFAKYQRCFYPYNGKELQSNDFFLLRAPKGPIAPSRPSAPKFVEMDGLRTRGNGFGLFGHVGHDLKIDNNKPAGLLVQEWVNGRWNALPNANLFKHLSTISSLGGIGLVGGGEYSRYAPNFQVVYQVRKSASPVADRLDNGMTDASFDASTTAPMLLRAVNAVVRVLSSSQEREAVLACGEQRSKTEIPSGYSKTWLHNNLAYFLNNGVLAVGAYIQPVYTVNGTEVLSNAFTYPQPYISAKQQWLIGIDMNIVAFARNGVSADRKNAALAGVIFHEILHNYGFTHTSNDPSSYVNRNKAILAHHDCMTEHVERNRY